MQAQKRTYSIDPAILSAFESTVKIGSRSDVINSLLREYLLEQEREETRRNIEAGAPLVRDEYLAESKRWYPLEEEVYAKANFCSVSAN